MLLLKNSSSEGYKKRRRNAHGACRTSTEEGRGLIMLFTHTLYSTPSDIHEKLSFFPGIYESGVSLKNRYSRGSSVAETQMDFSSTGHVVFISRFTRMKTLAPWCEIFSISPRKASSSRRIPKSPCGLRESRAFHDATTSPPFVGLLLFAF